MTTEPHPAAERSAGKPEATAAAGRQPSWRTAVALFAILAAAVAVRIPYLANATVFFNSDEAANALFLKHLLQGRELSLHPWDATYYGIVEPLLAIPCAWVAGLHPLAFKLAAVSGLLLLIVATFLLGRRLLGTAEGLVAAALLALVSPRLVQWSAFATGGLVLVAAWGSFSFLYFDRFRCAPSRRGFFFCGLCAGFGLYLYELYAVYLAVFAIAAAAASFAWRAVRAESPAARREAWRSAPRQIGNAALLFLGLAAGWLPKLFAVASRRLGGKVPLYAAAGIGRVASNLKLLVTRCVPALLGANPRGEGELEKWVGSLSPLSPLLGWVLLSAWAAAWLWGLAVQRRDLAAALRRPPHVPETASLLVLLVPVTALLFVLSPNARDVHSDHYLLPWLSALPIFAGGLLVRAARRAPVAAGLLALAWLGIPAFQITTWYQDLRVLDGRLHLVRHRESLCDVLAFLRAKGIRGGYSWYWGAYKATFLSDEQIVIAPLWDWDRYPAYTRRADRLPTEAYLFEYQETPAGKGLDARHAEFARRLRAAGIPHEAQWIGKFLVYTSPCRRRLLAPPLPLAHPVAGVAAGAPAEVRPGEAFSVRVRLTNRGGEPWSAFGDAIGLRRVDLSYRWLLPGGAVLVRDGERTLLPADLYPGQSIELSARVVAPSAQGDYHLVVSPVQEGVAWFADVGGGAAVRAVRVRPGPPGATVSSQRTP